MPLARRSLIKAFAAGSAAALLGRPSWGQGAGPTQASEIDLDKAKAEGKVVLYTSLDTQIVDAINAAFKQKYGIDVQYFRGGSSDVTSKVLPRPTPVDHRPTWSMHRIWPPSCS